MCWTTTYNNHKQPRRAGKDLKVFKICLRCPTNDAVKSFYTGYAYTIGKTNTLKGGLKPTAPYGNTNSVMYDMIFIHRGFHSYNPDKVEIKVNKSIGGKRGYNIHVTPIGINHNIDHFGGIDPDMFVKVSCTIPEGTEYYENHNGEIVSESIRIENFEPIIKD